MEAKDYITSDEGAKLQNVLHKELDLIQAVITRMAQNSFYMKGWCITLVAAIFSLSEKVATKTDVFVPLAILSAFFWVLDTNYLRLEKKYRDLYKMVLKRRLEKGDYGDLYSLNYNLAEKQENGGLKRRMFAFWKWIMVFFSWSESCLYAPLIVLLIWLNFGGWVWLSNRFGYRTNECSEGPDKQCRGKTPIQPSPKYWESGEKAREQFGIRSAKTMD